MFTLTLDQNTQKLLDDIADKLTKTNKPPIGLERRLGAVIRGGFLSNFNQERSGRGQWAPLRPRTVQDRIRRGFPGHHPILVRTGNYRRSFIYQHDAMHLSNLTMSADGWSLEVGSRDPRVNILEGGDSSRNIPPRPVTILDTDAEHRIGEFLDNLFYQLLS